MGRKARVVAGATAVVAGPSGMRRFAGGCLVVILLGVLVLAGGIALIAWLGTHGGGDADSGLPCPPSPVQVRYTGNPPAAVRDRVTEVIAASGRTVATTTDPAADDIAVAWSPGGTSYAGQRDLRVASQPTAAWLRSALGDRLTTCKPKATAQPAKTPTKGAAKPTATPKSKPDTELPSITWPWSGGWTPVASLALALAVWWLAGPNMLRGAWRAVLAVLWPMRLTWRRAQRWAYRRRLRRGQVPDEWPERLSPGQRWHEDESAMRDRRTPRAQVRETERARRAALRAAIRAERLAGTGVGPVSLWRLIYRVPDNNAAPTPGAPEMAEVSS